MKEHKTYDIYYDEESDFLEVSFEQPTMAGTTEEIQEGVFVTRDAETRRVANVGILSFKKRVGILKEILNSLGKRLPIEISRASNYTQHFLYSRIRKVYILVVYSLYITMAFIRQIKTKSGTYLAKVEGYRKDGKVKQRVLEYLGKEIDGKPVKKVFTNKIEVKSVKQSLDILAIDKVADELKIKSLENPYVLSLVYSQLLEDKSIKKLESWIKYTEIPSVLRLDKVSVKKLYESLADINDENFEKINEEMFSVFNNYEDISKATIIDITDTYFAGSKINIKKRKGKDKKISKLTQIGLAVSFENGFPIFHKQYHGNLSGMD
ncbi:hypothetical protein J4447_02720, partial [Candidatus Pacearchaeota archaeon]|nr:hypothetical protein [Candidatus Pacearchaeota archaeon]